MEATIPELRVVGVRSPSDPVELQSQAETLLFGSFNLPIVSIPGTWRRGGDSNSYDPFEPSGLVNCPFHRLVPG